MNVYMNWEWDGKGNYTRYCWHKLSQIAKPGPSEASVFIDEHEKSITQNGYFLNHPNSLTIFGSSLWTWLSFPTLRHNNGCTVGFADGHVESWRFREGRTAQIANMSVAWLFMQGRTSANDRDLKRFMDTLPEKVPMY